MLRILVKIKFSNRNKSHTPYRDGWSNSVWICIIGSSLIGSHWWKPPNWSWIITVVWRRNQSSECPSWQHCSQRLELCKLFVFKPSFCGVYDELLSFDEEKRWLPKIFLENSNRWFFLFSIIMLMLVQTSQRKVPSISVEMARFMVVTPCWLKPTLSRNYKLRQLFKDHHQQKLRSSLGAMKKLRSKFISTLPSLEEQFPKKWSM